jgi:MFS family permease
MSLVTLFVGVLQTLFAPMVLSLTDARTLGLVQSTGATGMVLASLLLGIFGLKRRHAEALLAGLLFAGISMALIGLSTRIAFIGTAFFLFFCTLPFINTGADVLIRSRIPNRRQGRVWGIVGVLSQTGYIAAYGGSGLLADRIFGPLLSEHGRLADTIGRVVGTGPGRGIAFLLVLSGLCIVIVAASASRLRHPLAMEK